MRHSRRSIYDWTREHGQCLRQIIDEAGSSITDVAAVCDVERSTVYRWLNGQNAPRNEEQRQELAKALEYASFRELYRHISVVARSSWSRPLEFKRVFDVLRQVDDAILNVLRYEQSIEDVAIFYAGGMEKKLDEMGFDANELLKLLQSDQPRSELASSMSETDLIVEVADFFERIAFVPGNDVKPLTILQPELLWDCACREGLPETMCPIHGHPLGHHVQEAFFKGNVSIRYRGVDIRWQDHAALWPPSVDSFQMVAAILQDSLPFSNVRSVLDIGSGTGFLGVVLAANNSSVERLDLSDWLLLPLLYGAVNWHLNMPDRQVRFHYHLGISDDWLGERKKRHFYDLVVCNPPYLPQVHAFPALACQSAVAGTKLLEWIIENGPALGRRTYVQCSCIARPEAERAAARAGVRLKLVGKERLIPFRVRHALQVPEYMELLKDPSRGLSHRSDTRHKYWHSIATYRVERE